MTGKLRSITFSLSMVTVLLAWAASSLVAENRVNKNKKGLALRGFDAVAYFEPGKPVKGSDQFTHKWNGATWRFASAGHRDQFAADPEQYAPQFGGYCAFAVTQGSTVDADPKVWRVLDGKLYLNYSSRYKDCGGGTLLAISKRPTPSGQSCRQQSDFGSYEVILIPRHATSTTPRAV